jgi:hypothetical protein
VSTFQTNAIFELQIKNKEGVEATWTIDVKNEPTVYKGPANTKPGVTILMGDETFQTLAEGKVSSPPLLPHITIPPFIDMKRRLTETLV